MANQFLIKETMEVMGDLSIIEINGLTLSVVSVLGF
jgi:hypothetical protein